MTGACLSELMRCVGSCCGSETPSYWCFLGESPYLPGAGFEPLRHLPRTDAFPCEERLPQLRKNADAALLLWMRHHECHQRIRKCPPLRRNGLPSPDRIVLSCRALLCLP
jgi:hypothetical protein